MGKALTSYAAEIDLSKEDSNTNVENVKFDVYLDVSDKSKRELEKDINAEDLKLFVSVSVQGGGYLSSGQIEFANCNFKLNNNEEENKLKLDSIQSERGIVKELSIVAVKDEEFDLSLLDMVSQIKLTGEYINNAGEKETVESTKQVKIKWTAENITEENNPIKLEQEIITNKKYEIEGTNKRVIQVAVKSGIENNKYPIEKTEIEIEVPKLGEEYPEEVIVASYGTKATNGKDSIEFGAEEENKAGKWIYNEEEQTVKITVGNEAKDNKVKWGKNGEDKFVVTYVYSENVDTTNFVSSINSTIKLYETKNTELNRTSLITKGNMEEIGDAITIDVEAAEVIYKSNMNLGQETEFEVDWTIGVGYSEIAKGMGIINGQDKLILEDSEINANTYYKSTYINKEEFLKILGENGEITLAYLDGNGEITSAKVINKESQTDENGNICVNYEEKISTLLIATSAPVSEGTIRIKHEKMLNTTEVSKEQISKINKLNSDVQLLVYKDENNEEEVIDSTDVNEILVEEPKTEIEIGIDKTKLSTTQENNVNITVTLKEDELKYRLYNNPTIEIELPKEVKNVEAKNVSILNEEQTGLTAKEAEIVETNTGNKAIKIELEGEQTEYIGQDVQVLINADIETTHLMPTVEREIVVRCANEEEVATDSKKVIIEAEEGILLANKIGKYNGEEPEIEIFKKEDKTGLLNAEAEAIEAEGIETIINNTGEKVENIVVIGKNTAQITMENAEIYYTKDEEVSLNSNWEEEYTEEVTGYKVVIGSIEKEGIIEIPYKLRIPAQIGTNKKIEIGYEVYSGENKIEESGKIVLETEQEVKLELEVTPSVENGAKVYEGNILSYEIKVSNIGEEVARNVEIRNEIPGGTTKVEGTENSWTIEEIKAGESVSKTVQIQVKELGEGETLKTITNTTIVTAPNLKEELKSVTSNIVRKSNISVEIVDYYGDGANIYENGQLKYKTTIKNISGQEITGIEITNKIPEGTTYVKDIAILEDSSFNEITDMNIETKVQDDKVIYNIEKLQANQQIVLLFELKPNLLELDEYEKIITYEVELNADQIERYSVTKNDIVIKPKITMESSSINKSDENRTGYVNSGDILEYTTIICNENKYSQTVVIEGMLPSQLSLVDLQYSLNGEENKPLQIDGGEYYLEETIQPNKTIKIVLSAKVENIVSDSDVVIENSIKCRAKIYDREGFGEDTYRDELNNTIEYKIKGISENPEEPEQPKEPEYPTEPETPTNPENPEEPKEEKTYKISGLAWLDENENGEQEGTEKLLNGILVKIKDAQTKEYLKNENGDNITVTTNENGLYEFEGLKSGKYVVEFEYDKSVYKLTPETRKDSAANVVTTEDNTVVRTGIITITNKDIDGISIGLCLNPIYDLELNKYVSKITVQNGEGTKTYNYDKEQLAKVDIKAKKLAGSIVIVEYTIEVKNKGEVEGYAKTIVDYLSPEFKFNSEMNTSWYEGEDNNLYCVELADEKINPGESKEVKLVVTKTMTEANTGLVNNTAEIYEDFNEYALEDINSVAGNKEEKENDINTADVIITISTGSPILYIGIVIGSMLILGLGIYLINKKIIKRKII